MTANEYRERDGIENQCGDCQRPEEGQDIRPPLGEDIPSGVNDRGDQHQSDSEKTHRRRTARDSPFWLVLATDSASPTTPR
jgi:hypothetical protein